jgi:hypothetical protein
LLRRADDPAGLPLLTAIDQMPRKFEWSREACALNSFSRAI